MVRLSGAKSNPRDGLGGGIAQTKMVRAVGIEPTLLSEPDFESGASTSFTTPACMAARAKWQNQLPASRQKSAGVHDKATRRLQGRLRADSLLA